VSDVDGNLKRVGKQCLKVYLPGWSLPLTDAMGRYLSSLDNWFSIDTESFGGRRDREAYEIIMAAIRAIEVYGFKPRQFDDASTASIVSTYLMPPSQLSDRDRTMISALRGVDAAVVGQVYALVMAYINELDAKENRSLFESNMIVAARVGGLKNLGICCYVAEAYRKHLVGQIEASKAVDVVKVDAPIGRTTVVGTVEKVMLKYDAYSDRNVRKLIVADDRGFKVYVTEPSNIYCEGGERVSMSIDIKSVSDRDRSFGFGSRPTKAVNLDATPETIDVNDDLTEDDDL